MTDLKNLLLAEAVEVLRLAGVVDENRDYSLRGNKSTDGHFVELIYTEFWTGHQHPCITFLKGVILHEGRDSWEIEDYLMAQGYGKVDVIQGL